MLKKRFPGSASHLAGQFPVGTQSRDSVHEPIHVTGFHDKTALVFSQRAGNLRTGRADENTRSPRPVRWLASPSQDFKFAFRRCIAVPPQELQDLEAWSRMPGLHFRQGKQDHENNAMTSHNYAGQLAGFRPLFEASTCQEPRIWNTGHAPV